MRKCHCHSPATSAYPIIPHCTPNRWLPFSHGVPRILLTFLSYQLWHATAALTPLQLPPHLQLSSSSCPETCTTCYHQLPPLHKAPQPVQHGTASTAQLEQARGVRPVFPPPPAPPLCWWWPNTLPVVSCPDSDHSGKRKPLFYCLYTYYGEVLILAGASRCCYVQTINNNHS